MFRAEDTSRANYRSLFEYAAGVEARLAQDRRLVYYEQVLPEMLTRVKGLPLMYQTYSKRWSPESSKDAFIVKRRVPDLSKPIYITDDEGNKVQKGFETQDLVMENDKDIPAFMTRKGRFKGQHGFNKGFSYLAPIYHVERDQMPFVLVDLDIDRADFSKAAWGRLLTAVTKVYDWFRLNGFDPLINFTGSSFHIWAKDGQVRSYAETKLLLEQLSKEVDLPLAAGAAHIKGQITIDYPQNKYRAPLRFPLSIHGDTGLASIIIPRNQLRKFDPLSKAHPDQVLKQLPNHLAKIDAWFSDLPQTKQSAEEIITAHLDTLNEDDLERCMWGDCGVLADELMAKLQAAGYTDAVYEIGRAYIHPFEEYDDKTFIGGHVVVTVDGVSYDALGAGAKQRWVDGPVIQEILAENGFSELGPLLSSHLTVSWITSTWDEVQETRRHNFAGKLVDFESEGFELRPYTEGFPNLPQQGWFTNILFHGYDKPLGTEELPALKISYRLKHWPTLPNFADWGGEVRELHLSLHPDYQGQGLAAKMVRSSLLNEMEEVYDADVPFYLAYGRIINPDVFGVVDKLRADPLIKVTDISTDGEVTGVIIELSATGKKIESEEMSKTWYSSGNVHPWQLFLDTETLGPDLFGERDNYPYEDMKALESKYGLKPTSAVIWVSAMPEVAASYMIGQGLLDNSDEEVKDNYGFSKSDLETTEFGQVYYPPHVDQVGEYQGTVMLETDDGDGGYLLSLNRDYTGRYGLKRIGMAAETEYKKKRKKPTPEPGVEGSGKLKPSRRKPPMKVKGSDVYSVQKHRATKRGSHRDIRIGLDGKLLSFVPVGRYEKKDEDGKWQKSDGSRLPKKIGEGVSVIRTEDHPFDYWWFEGDIPKDSYGAGPVSLETHGTRRIIEWIPDEKLKVELIGGKYAGTYTFERSKKSKDGKVWWMRKSRPIPKDKTDKKTKKAEISDEGYCSECTEHWSDIGKHPAVDGYEWSEESVRKALDSGPDYESCWNCYALFTNVEDEEDEFDYYTDMFTQDVVDTQTVKKYIDSIHDGYFAWWDDLDDLEFTLQKVPLTMWDNIERSEVDGQWIDAPVGSHRLSDTLRQFGNQHPDDDYPPVVLKLDERGNYHVIDGFHRLNALQILGEEGVMAWVGTPVVNRKTKKSESLVMLHSKLNFTRAFSSWIFIHNHQNYSPATRYIDNLLNEAKYMQGKIILYRAITLANPEDFDPTETGESWTPNKYFAEPYFGHHSDSYEKYILTALVPVESVDWEESVARAIAFGPPSDEKEIVLKRGAPIELINLPMELSFAIDATPEALIRAAEDVRDQYGYSMFSKALAEWSEKFLAGELNAKEMIERAYYDDGAGPGDGIIVDYNPSSGIVSIESGVSSGGMSARDAIERFARRYVEDLLISAKYYRGRIKLYRGIQLVNPEDFDPTEVGRSWTPIKSAAIPYFGFQKYYSRNLERIYSRTADSKTYVLTALVPVESVDWYYTLMRALSFGMSDEKEIVLKRGAPIELIDVPIDLSFMIDRTPEALIRASEEEDDEDWWFTMNTPLGPDEEFGPYDSHEEAMKGIERIMQKVISLQDGYTREFPRAYQGRRGSGFGLRAEDKGDMAAFAANQEEEIFDYVLPQESVEWGFLHSYDRPEGYVAQSYKNWSAPITGELLDSLLENSLYHGTTERAWDLIQRNGYFTPREPFETGDKAGQESLKSLKNPIMRQIGTYVTPVAGHAWQYATGDWGPSMTQNLDFVGGVALVLKINPDLVRDLPWFIDLRDRAPSFFTTGRIPVEAVERVIEIPAEWPQRGFTTEPFSWYEHPLMPFLSEGLHEIKPSYLKGKALKAHQFWQEAIFEPGFLETRPKEYQREWWKEYQRQIEEFYVSEMGLTPAEVRLIQIMGEDDESISAFIRSENMGEPYDFNLWTRWWPKPRTSAETTRPYKDYSLEDLLDVTGDWKAKRQELGIRMANLLQERQWASEDIDLTVGGKSAFERKYIAKVTEYESSNKWLEDVETMDMMGDETYIYALEGRLEYMFPKLEHPLSQAEYDELKAANPELIAEEKAIARSISEDMLNRVYEMLFSYSYSYNFSMFVSDVEYREGKILLYREITMNSPEDLDTARAGIFWTPVLGAAKAHWGGKGEHFLLQALVDFEDIDWTSSWYANLIMPEECELRVRQGAKIELLPLKTRGGKYVYPEEIVFEIDEPNPNLLAVERGTETELLEAIKDLPEEYRRLIGIYPVEPQPTQTGFASEDIDLTVGEAFDKALAEIRADVEAVQPRSKDLSEVTLEDYEKTKQVYQRFMIPAGITGSIVKDEWYYDTEPIYNYSGLFILRGFGEEEWKLKIDAQRSETESNILASDEINYAFYWYAIMQINSIYNWLLSRLGERKMHTGAYAGPPVELPEIIESQRDSTDIKIYRWLATSPGEEPVRRLRNRMRPVDVNYYGGYADVDRMSNRTTGGPHGVRKGLKSLSYGPCWSLSPDAYTRTDQWRLAQEDVVLKENEKAGISLKRKLMDEEIDTRTYVIEKSLPASGVDWYSTLISSALWLDDPEYEVIPKRGVFLSEEITESSDFEQEFNRVETVVSDLFKEFSWWSDNQKELYDVSDLHKDAAGRARLQELESHLATLTRPGSLLWSSGDDSAYDAYPGDLHNPTYVFEESGIYVEGEDDNWETDGYTDEERGEPGEEVYQIGNRPKSPDYHFRLRYAYTLNCLSQLAEQYFSRLDHLRRVLKPQFDSDQVTIYRALALTEDKRPVRRRQTIFPMSMRVSRGTFQRYWENPEIREKYTYESYGPHWSLIRGFEWSNDFPSYSGGRAVTIEKQIPYTEVDWFNTLLIMAYGREPEFEVAVNENVFLAENEVKIPLYHVTPLDQVPNILETGLEPRIGPRSKAMELESRIWLFGDQESVDQALMNWLGDEMYGAEWRSGYAVLRIDLPADWFKQRRVEKTFDPYGSERSWEWSTSENIPGEFIEVIDKWTWSEDELVDFQADFGMPVYGKYLRDARNQAELDLSTISDDYKYFHLSWDRFVINQDGETFTFTPRVPEYPFGWMSGSIEDDFTPRVSLSSTVKGCLEALPDDDDGRWYVYGTKQTDNIISVRDYFEECPDDYGRSFEMIKWINSLPEEDQLIIKNYDSPWTGRDLSEIDFSEKYAEINVSDLPPKYRDMFYACVPDALQHDEYWSLEPITMDYLGYITWETLGPSEINEFVYFSAPESTEIKYPLRLYHGTSVRNWRAIQSSGELRTGCLASSHGYDIDMPATYIDLAIAEIEDNHPDIKAGGVVLDVTFPDQATADQYLQADTTMYDLGMAVLEDDLYHRYAPADWQPEDAQEGWHYGSWDWFETDFQDLVKSNQATKTIPYSPQDLSDWQASYLSVYSVCIKQPIPLKYITVDWGSESRRAEEETSETVGEAWDKALVKWYELVDWAKHEREKGFRDVSTTELQQAIEVYNILNRVSYKITEPNFLGGSLDETVMERLIQTYAKDDLELQKTLREHYEELHILTIPYVVKSKTMNYFFYYGIIEWIIMMTWRLNSLNSYGGKELDDAISSQFQDSTLKAYRWISVGNDEVPSRNMNFNNYADFSYGRHWSLHPEVYTQTTEWEGFQYQKDYLIEKDVPVEDIDWFETLISCLFFLDAPELEIIMNPMAFIAETIDESHLYLDMDGCFADFAGAITQRVNEVLQVQDVSEIPSKSLRRAARKAKELGITSVTERDFDLSLSHDPVKKKVIDRMLYKIASEPGFFYNLEVMNRDILDEIIASGRPFSFLSAPIGGTKDYSIEDKRAWVRDRLGLDVTVNVVPREEKVTFCQPGDILIDDHVTTISEWTAAGGQGVLFPQEIDEFLRKPYNGGATTYQAEEVEKVKQYPIVYKKNATGTLQQWQVLLLPQESGGYLLTTASGKVGGKITQGRGKLIKEGKVNRTALEQAELQADSKFKKKKDEGYFPTKEEAHQNLVLLPMKALDFKKRSHDITYPAVAQRKFDGVRCLAIPQADGSVRLMSRTGKTWTHLHHLQSQIEALNLDSNMVLDGEVYSDTLTFEDATGLVRRQTLKPGDEEKMKQIDYRLYDAILLDNPNATFLDRYSKLAALFPPASSTEGRRMGHLVLTENFPLRNREDLLALHRQFTTDEDFEGVMVRNLHGTYDINKRSKHLQKFKEFQDAEYKIVGYNEASGDWQGTPIWICEMADGRQFNVTPTGDRPSRIEMFNNIEDYMGKLLTVKFFELTADGVPRHGVGLAIRDYE